MELIQKYDSLFPDYQFLKLVGQGSYGDVYRCIRKSDKIQVAIKIIRNPDSDSDGLSVSSLREIMFMRYCQHPNVAHIYDIISAKVTLNNDYDSLPPLAIVMEYVDHDLLGLLKSSRMGFSNWLSIDAIRWIMYQLFSSLAYLHRHNVIHRDIKPANLLITSQCDLRLADFGLSRRIGNPLITKYTSRVITLWYRPPELILGSTFYGPEVDIWSAGCILVELLTGTTLFPNYNNNEYYQLQLIFSRCGYPDDPLLLNLMKKSNLIFNEPFPRSLPGCVQEIAHSVKNQQYTQIPDEALDLIDMILQTSPSRRPTAARVLKHPFFRGMSQIEFPFPVLMNEGCHDLEVKNRISTGICEKVSEVHLVKQKKSIDSWVSEREIVDLCDEDEQGKVLSSAYPPVRSAENLLEPSLQPQSQSVSLEETIPVPVVDTKKKVTRRNLPRKASRRRQTKKQTRGKQQPPRKRSTSVGEFIVESPLLKKKCMTREERRQKWDAILLEEEQKKAEKSAMREAKYLSRVKMKEEASIQKQIQLIEKMNGDGKLVSNPSESKNESLSNSL